MDNQIEYFILLLSFLFSFAATFFSVPWIIPRLKERRLFGIDMNKPEKPQIPEMGGISVVFGFFFGIYLLLIINFFYLDGSGITPYILASLITILGIAFIGLLDDLINLSQKTKAILPFFFSLHLGLFVSPLMFVPIIGHIDFGFLMILMVPFGITCASNSTNMLEGFNGLGTGLGLIITSTLIVLSIANESFDGLYLLVPLLGSLIAFMYYNKYPAKIFPGDTLTLFLGGTIGCAAIINNLKLEGVILMLPMIIEFFLKLRGNFKGECFAKFNENGILLHEGRIESLTHILMQNFAVDEKKLVLYFWSVEILLAIFVLFFSFY